MAGGRDLRRRSPRWLNCLICSCGLTAIGCFLWRMIASDSDGSEVMLGTTALISRLIAIAVLPALLLVTCLGRAARRLVRKPEEGPASGVLPMRPAVRALGVRYRLLSNKEGEAEQPAQDSVDIPPQRKVAAG